ncbi:transposase [Desulfovibrio inopinatus]|uniref:transposase n=1 Tax=Desulfovibrio inopinatus TaxID=102109 RepID=UPI0004227312|nr:transposase [Desulfovibrio inopinatus]
MPRIARLLLSDQPSVYHVMSRTALDGFPFDALEKDILLSIIKQFSTIYFCEVLGFALMGNHFHLLLRMYPPDTVTNQDVTDHFKLRYGPDAVITELQINRYRQKWTNLSELMREIKQTFSRSYNRRHNRRGYLWGDRYKSVIVEDGRTLINCLAYIDLNPVRAGIVKHPEKYRWCSLGYHLQSGNQDNFLSLDFGLNDWDIAPKTSTRERLRLYRQFLAETGTLAPSPNGPRMTIPSRDDRNADDEYTLIDRLLLRTRWFTDAGIIGSKSFVSRLARRFKVFTVKDRPPKQVTGLNMYSLKRLSEIV